MFGFKHGVGAVIVGGRHVADTIQCVHCGMHWIPKPGSGTKRGWCPTCKGPCCGKDFCMKDCIPYEARLEIEEGTRGPGDIYFDRYMLLKNQLASLK